jgi:hypothetical protein
MCSKSKSGTMWLNFTEPGKKYDRTDDLQVALDTLTADNYGKLWAVWWPQRGSWQTRPTSAVSRTKPRACIWTSNVPALWSESRMSASVRLMIQGHSARRSLRRRPRGKKWRMSQASFCLRGQFRCTSPRIARQHIAGGP